MLRMILLWLSATANDFNSVASAGAIERAAYTRPCFGTHVVKFDARRQCQYVAEPSKLGVPGASMNASLLWCAGFESDC